MLTSDIHGNGLVSSLSSSINISQDLRSKYTNRWGNMQGALCHLQDCAGNHYRLQLNAYRYILETYYGFQVKAMYVVCTHPDNGDLAFIDNVPFMPSEVSHLMEYQHGRAWETNQMDMEDIRAVDPLGSGESEDDDDFCHMLEETLGGGSQRPSTPPADHSNPFLDAPPTPIPDAFQDDPATPASKADEEARPIVGPLSVAGSQGIGSIVPDTQGIMDEEIAIGALGSDGAPNPKARKRRQMKGAATSSQDFTNLFETCERMATQSLEDTQPQVIMSKSSIIPHSQQLFETVKRLQPDWDHYLVKLGVAALAIYRMRLVDMFLREQVLLLWIIEGEDYMRAHCGTCYLYHNDGAFIAYKGLVPEDTFGRVKDFLLELEGSFRLLPQNVQRTDQGLLEAIHQCKAEHSDTKTYLSSCQDAAIYCAGERGRRPVRRRRAGNADEAEPEEPADVEEVLVHWNIHTATALSKIGLQIQKALLEERIISFVIEWCDTPHQAVPGVAYSDTCVTYDRGGNHVITANKSPRNNIYLRIPHPLLDPLQQDADQGLKIFITQTFWANCEVYLCFQAAQALAKRGENICRCFIGISPGGVGQSLYSMHLHAVYGPLHCFFDPNIWYHDDEIRTGQSASAHVSRPIPFCSLSRFHPWNNLDS